MNIEISMHPGEASSCCGAPVLRMTGMPQLICGKCRNHCQVAGEADDEARAGPG